MEIEKILLIFILLNAYIVVSTPAELQELSSSLINLETKAKSLSTVKPIIQPKQQKTGRSITEEIDEEFYKQLNKALNQSSFSEINKELKSLPRRTGTTVAQYIINLLRKDSVNELTKPIWIRYKTLELEFGNKLQFTSYILLIAKIVETLMPLHKPQDTISIFSDNIVNDPLLLLLLIGSLHQVEYKSIEINLVSNKKTDFTELEKLLKAEFGVLKSNINQYTTIKDLIDSGNKIDMYLTNYSIPEQSKGLVCKEVRGKALFKIFAEHSSKIDSNYLFATKAVNAFSDKDKIFNQLVESLTNPTLVPSFCKENRTFSTDLADLIYSTNRTNSKVPLFVIHTFTKDTGLGMYSFATIVLSQLNFKEYVDILAALFKIGIAIERPDFDQISKLYNLFTIDKADPKEFILLKSYSNNVPSKVTTFIRSKQLIDTSKITISD